MHHNLHLLSFFFFPYLFMLGVGDKVMICTERNTTKGFEDWIGCQDI